MCCGHGGIDGEEAAWGEDPCNALHDGRGDVDDLNANGDALHEGHRAVERLLVANKVFAGNGDEPGKNQRGERRRKSEKMKLNFDPKSCPFIE